MESKKYLEFDLMLEASDLGYRARVLNAPAGTAVGEFGFPFSEMELENFILRMGQKRQTTRGGDSSEMAAAREFGTRLYDTVFVGTVRSALDGSLFEASQQSAGLRIRLRFASNAPELIDLPWEYLYNPDKNRFLNLSVDSPLVRDLDLTGRIEPLEIIPPLRVLVMIASPNDYDPLDVEEEWSRLKESVADLEASGHIVLDRTDTASLSSLHRQLRKEDYHIFHFIGHGAFDEQAKDGVLVFVDENGRGRKISGQQLGTILHDEKTLRLAILNACEGGRASFTDPFAGVAQSLLQQDIPAVIAMQFEVSDKAAITLAHEFYAAIAVGYPVDAALSEARKIIYAEVSDVEWGTPVLYMRVADGRIFDVVGPAIPVPPPPVVLPSPTPVVVSPAPAATVQPSAVPPAATVQPTTQSTRNPLLLGGIAAILVILSIATYFALPSFSGSNQPTNVPRSDLNENAVVIVAEKTATPTATVAETVVATATEHPTSTPTRSLIEQVRIGFSAKGTSINITRIGTGSRHIVFVGGIHGGYAPSSVTLAEKAVEHFTDNPMDVPSTATLHIITNLNPDSPRAPGKVEGRLNGNGVDLNRNWDCDWKPNAVWRTTTVSGGSKVFSESETLALRDYFLEKRPQAVVFWEAQRVDGLASPGGCENSSRVSEELAEIYGNATGYKVIVHSPLENSGNTYPTGCGIGGAAFP